jgi:putative DNA methylase
MSHGGCKSLWIPRSGVALNPVAHLIELCTLVYPQKYGLGPDTEAKRKQGLTFGESACQLAEDVRKWGKWVLEEAKKEIGHLYPKVNGKTTVAYLWARTVKCPNPACGATVPLLKQTWLRKKKGKNIALNMVPIPEEKRVAFKIVEGDEADGSQGTMDRNSSTCPCCKTTIAKDYLENEGKSKRFGQQLLAIVCQNDGTGKDYLEALPEEEKRLEQAEKELTEKLIKGALETDG